MLVIKNISFVTAIGTDALDPFYAVDTVNDKGGLIAKAVGYELFVVTTVTDTLCNMTVRGINTDVAV